MSADVIPIRPRVQETFVCPCGSQWFSFHKRVDTNGHHIETSPVATCDGCNRKHHVIKRDGDDAHKH